MRILVVNAGSSSLKVRLLDGETVLSATDLPAPDWAARDIPGDVAAALERMQLAGAVEAVGHRVVHGGTELTSAIEMRPKVVEQLEALTDLAPLHQPASLAAWRWAAAALPGVPHVACFDTAFHATLSNAAATYALPAVWRARWPLRRFGFHGLSHAYVAGRAAALMERPVGQLRLVTAHLGAGASLAAVQNGRSVDTTMGFTPLEGLVMATRSGSIDPGLVLWLQQRGGLSPEAVADGLEHQSGLQGLAGTADMREVLAAAAAGSSTAALARDVYLHRLRAGIASMAAAMGGLDALVFTGGVGEHAPSIRAGAAQGLGFLGLELETMANEDGTGDRRIDQDGANAAVLVVESREDLEIARQVWAWAGQQTG